MLPPASGSITLFVTGPPVGRRTAGTTGLAEIALMIADDHNGSEKHAECSSANLDSVHGGAAVSNHRHICALLLAPVSFSIINSSFSTIMLNVVWLGSTPPGYRRCNWVECWVKQVRPPVFSICPLFARSWLTLATGAALIRLER